MTITDLKLVRNIAFTKKNFAWTTYGLLMMNVMAVTTSFVVGIENNKTFIEIVKVIPTGMAILSIVSVVIFPFIDVWENVTDQIMCRELGWSWQAEFLTMIDAKTQDNIRDTYKKMLKDYKSIEQIRKALQEKYEVFEINQTLR